MLRGRSGSSAKALAIAVVAIVPVACSLTLASDAELVGEGGAPSSSGATFAIGSGGSATGGTAATGSAGDTGTSMSTSSSTTSGSAGASSTMGSGGATGGGGAGATGGSGGAGGGLLSAYVTEVLADAPLGYYRFGEASGNIAFDSSGHGNDGDYVNCALGAPGLLAGDPDTAAVFDGVISKVTAPSFDFTGLEHFSIEAWIKPTTISASDYHHVLNDEKALSVRQGYAIFITSSANLRFERFIDDSNVVAAGPNLVVGTVVHIVGTYDGATLRLYVNGVLSGSAPDARPAVGLPDPFFVGCGDSVKFFDGIIDEVAIYGTELSAARVLAHYQAGQ